MCARVCARVCVCVCVVCGSAHRLAGVPHHNTVTDTFPSPIVQILLTLLGGLTVSAGVAASDSSTVLGIWHAVLLACLAAACCLALSIDVLCVCLMLKQTRVGIILVFLNVVATFIQIVASFCEYTLPLALLVEGVCVGYGVCDASLCAPSWCDRPRGIRAVRADEVEGGARHVELLEGVHGMWRREANARAWGTTWEYKGREGQEG